MIAKVVRTTAYWSLITVAVFNALSALAGGIAILATNGLGMPVSMLKHGPFTSFSVPALILVAVVGGTQAVSAVLVLLRRDSALAWSAIAGFGMVIWIFVEVGIIQATAWIHVLYFATGAVQLVLVIALLGVVRWLPRSL